MTTTRRAGWALAAVVVLALASCAPLPPAPGGVKAPPSSTSPGKPAPVRTPPAKPISVVPADSMPTPEALAVLNTIPEPLRPGERVAPESRASAGASNAASAEDSTAVSAPAGDVPVPEPTQVMGERRTVAVDTSQVSPGSGSASSASPPASAPPVASSPPSAPPSASSPPQSPGSRALAAPPDTCWRVQILAPLDAATAEQTRATAASLLLVPLVIEQEQGRYKVRTQDCLTHTAADLLRRRAIESGFAQAFRISSVKR